MSNERLQLSIQSDVTGAADVDRLGKSLAAVPPSADRSGKSLEDSGNRARTMAIGFQAAELAISKYSGSLLRGAEDVAAFAGAHTLASRALVGFTAQTGSGISATNALVDSYRVLRLALSPTIFTAASVGVGVLVEETLRLVNARGKLIEQQSLLAAKTGISYGDVERIGAVSNLSGANASNINSALKALQSNAGTPKYTSALDSIGVPKYFQDAGSPQLLAQIAKGFSSIPDPVVRAQAAVDLFGSDLAATVLPQLNKHFADSAAAVDDWGLTLSETSRNQIFGFRRDLQNFKDDILGLGTGFEALGAKITQALTVAGAKTYDASKGALGAIGKTFGGVHDEYARAAFGADTKSGLSSAVFGADADPQRLMEYSIRKALSEPSQSPATGLLMGPVLGSIDRTDNTRAGVEAQLARQRASMADAETAIRKGNLTDAESRDRYAQYQAGAQGVNDATGRLRSFDDSRRQQEALLRSRELVNRSATESGAGQDLRGEMQKATTFTDDQGQIQRYTMLDETRRNLLAGFHTYALGLQKQASDEAVKGITQEYDLAVRFDAERDQKRRAYLDQTASMELSTNERTFSHENVVLGQTRDARLQNSELLGITPARTLRPIGQDRDDQQRQREVLEAAASLTQIRNRRDINSQYITNTSVNDAAAIERTQQAALIGVAVALRAGNIDQGQATERYTAINRDSAQQGTELNDKYASDLLKTQQDAVLDTTRVIKDLEDKQIDRIQAFVDKQAQSAAGFAGSMFDAVTGRQPNAIPNLIKSSALDFGKTITENFTRDTVYPMIRSAIPTSSSSLFKDTFLEASPTNKSAAALLSNTSSLDLTRSALESLTKATADLYAAYTGKADPSVPGSSGAIGAPAPGSLAASLAGSSSSALSPSGGGGSFGTLSVDDEGNPIGSAATTPLVSAKALSSLSSTLGGLTAGASSVLSGNALSILMGKGVQAVDPTTGQLTNITSPSLSSQIGAGVGLAGAMATGGYNIYEGLKQGGAGGDLKAAGAGVGLATSAFSNVAKLMGALTPALSAIPLVGSVISMALPLIGGLFNGPQQRANAISTELGSAQYVAPQALNVTQSSSGTFTDFDARGNIRTSDFSAVPTVRQGSIWEQTHGTFSSEAPTFYNVPGGQTSQFGAPVAQSVVNHNYGTGSIQTIDATSFQGLLNRNSNAVGDATASAMQNGHGRLTSEVQRAANP